MRISCNGCRVLRKGCSEDCSLRPCLIWLESPESQANATAFLAKFYGRAGLMNLISAAPSHLRPEIFRSLLYEACGRIINPVYGSVGLMSSGDWPRCHAAVQAVLSGGGGQLLNQAAGDDDSSLPGCDIRHVSKGSGVSPHRVTTRRRRKRSVSLADSVASAEYLTESDAKFTITGWDDCGGDRKDFVVIDHKSTRAPSHDSFSVETVEPSLMQFDERAEPEPRLSELGLELSLGLNPVLHSYLSTVVQISDSEY